MHWTATENVAGAVASLAVAAQGGADICVFPELALTGFHRGIREQAVPEVVEQALSVVRAACRRYGIACALGVPVWSPGGAIFNGYLYVDAAGADLSVVCKNGLTPSELTLFEPGTQRPVFDFAGRRCSTVMCREVEDVAAIADQIASDQLDLIFWPSQVGHPPGTVHPKAEDTNDLGYLKRTALLAKRLGVHIVQSNWPQALNTPEATWLGESKVYAPSGEVLLTLPRDAAGVGIFELGERDFLWTPIPA